MCVRVKKMIAARQRTGDLYTCNVAIAIGTISMMTDSPRNVRTLFDSGNRQREHLESSYDSNSSTYQGNLRAAISTFEECRRLADELSLFSQNESLEDISSGDLQWSHCVRYVENQRTDRMHRFLLISYYLAELILRDNKSDRKIVLNGAQKSYEKYLNLLDTYELLSASDRKLYERYLDNSKAFSTASTTDVAARRDTKIKRFRQEKELKGKLEARNLPYMGYVPFLTAACSISLKILQRYRTMTRRCVTFMSPTSIFAHTGPSSHLTSYRKN